MRCGGREGRELTLAPDADDEVVWFGRRGAGVKLAGSVPPMMVAIKPFTRKSTK